MGTCGGRGRTRRSRGQVSDRLGQARNASALPPRRQRILCRRKRSPLQAAARAGEYRNRLLSNICLIHAGFREARGPRSSEVGGIRSSSPSQSLCKHVPEPIRAGRTRRLRGSFRIRFRGTRGIRRCGIGIRARGGRDGIAEHQGGRRRPTRRGGGGGGSSSWSRMIVSSLSVVLCRTLQQGGTEGSIEWFNFPDQLRGGR